MNVDAVCKGFAQLRNVGDMGQHAQFDLAVVGRDQQVAGLGDKRRPDLAPFCRAHRNVLDIRLGRGQATGRRRGQRKARVHALGVRVDVARQRVGVGALQFCQLPPVNDLARQFMAFSGQILQHISRRRPLPGRGLLAAGHAHLAKENIAKLLGRARIEPLARGHINFFFQPRRRLAQTRRKAATGSGGRWRCRALPCGRSHPPAVAPAARRLTTMLSAARRGFSTCHSRKVTSASSAA